MKFPLAILSFILLAPSPAAGLDSIILGYIAWCYSVYSEIHAAKSKECTV